MKVYIVTRGYSDPRYTAGHQRGVYYGVFGTVNAAKKYVHDEVDIDKEWFDTVITGELTTEDGVIYVECCHRKQNKYFVYIIREEEVN